MDESYKFSFLLWGYTLLDTIHDLAPLLLTAEQENNHKALNKILDRMDSIRETQLRICR